MKHASTVAFSILLLVEPLLATEPVKRVADFNFDGHDDYCVFVLENGKADQWDVFLWNPETEKHEKDSVLSRVINPWPNEREKTVECIWPGGHSGMLFTKDVYRWMDGKFRLAATVRQESVTVNGRGEFIYVRVRAEMVNGKPQVTEVKRAVPHW
ncbi:MAG: hypothetical protein AAGA58_00725 [Verrucomicrobiota bacterium]